MLEHTPASISNISDPTEVRAVEQYREVRDPIERKVKELLASL